MAEKLQNSQENDTEPNAAASSNESGSNLKKAINSVNTCIFCNKELSTRANLERHMIQVHREVTGFITSLFSPPGKKSYFNFKSTDIYGILKRNFDVKSINLRKLALNPFRKIKALEHLYEIEIKKPAPENEDKKLGKENSK